MSAFVEYPDAVVLANARVKASWPGSLERVQVSVTLAVTWRALAQTLEDGPRVLREARAVAGEDSGTD